MQHDMQRLPYEARPQDHVLQQQQHHNVMEANRAPGGALYSDPYLSSNNHIRQASHDSGLGVTAMQYQSDVGMDFEDGMDTGRSSINKAPMNQEYVDSMHTSDIDTEGLQTDPHMQEQMESSLLGRWV